MVQWHSGTVVQWYSGRERTSTCMGVRSYLQANLKTSSLAGCLTPVGVMGEIVQLLLEGGVGTVRHHASATLMADDVCTIRHHGSRQ